MRVLLPLAPLAAGGAASPAGSGPLIWERITKFDLPAARLADGHYSRRTVGSSQYMPPGQTVILGTPLVDGERDAIFGWWRPHPDSGLKAMNGLDGWTCTIFRNIGPIQSSEMILEAEAFLAGTGLDCGPTGLITYVWDKKVATYAQPNSPVGYCFNRAGYRPAGRSADKKKGLWLKPFELAGIRACGVPA